MTLHVHEFGPVDGPGVLALHGLSSHGARFADLARRLGRHRIIAPDLRGHGRSPVLPPWHLERHVDDLVEVLDRYVPGAVPVVGHSLGGVLALRLAHAAPDRVSRLALLDPGTGMRPEKALANADNMLVDVSYPTEADARADRVRQGWADLPADLVDAELAHNLEQRSDGRWHWRYRRPVLAAALGELTARSHCRRRACRPCWSSRMAATRSATNTSPAAEPNAPAPSRSATSTAATWSTTSDPPKPQPPWPSSCHVERRAGRLRDSAKTRCPSPPAREPDDRAPEVPRTTCVA